MDIIGNNLTSIRNAYLAGHKSVILPNYKKINSLLSKLVESKIFSTTEKVDEQNTRYDFAPALKSLVIKRISKPGRRLYGGKSKVWDQKNLGFQVLSTSSGIMTDKEARDKKIGGEIICRVIAKFK